MLTPRRSHAARTTLWLFALASGGLAAQLGACGGRVVIDQGGSGGAASSTSSSTTDAVTTSSSGSFSVSVGTGSDPPPPCVSCSVYITDGPQGTLCPESQKLYDALQFCVCASKCIPQCADNACSGGQTTADCNGCIQKVCSDELNQCATDF
jgi:hypothetical protein